MLPLWLSQFDRGELDAEEAAATVAEYEAKVATLERKVGQLTVELGLVKKRHAQIVSSNESSSLVSFQLPSRSDGGAN